MQYYNIKISARNRVGRGLDWERQLVAVSEADIPGKSDAPIVKPFDDSSLNVTFQRPGYGGLPTKFQILVRPKVHYFRDPVIYEQKFPQRAWFLVKNLDHYVYSIWTVGVNELGQSETSDVTECRPVRRPKPQAHAIGFEWWRRNWFIAIAICFIFFVIVAGMLIVLLRKKPAVIYQELQESPTPPRQQQPRIQGGMELDNLGKQASSSDENKSLHSNSDDDDPPPPRYSSQSSLKKERPPSYDDDDRWDIQNR